MRKLTIMVAAIFAVAIATGAEAAKKKAAPADPAVKANAEAALFFSDMFQPWTPQRPVPGAPKGKKKR